MNILDYLENGKITQNSLTRMQADLFTANGRGFDIYHHEEVRGIIVTERGAGLSMRTSAIRISY